MWPPWGKSSPKLDNPRSTFRCSSFKDIQNLCNDDSGSPKGHQRPPSTLAKTSSIYHRVRSANSILRQWPSRSDFQYDLARCPSPRPTSPSPPFLEPESAPQPNLSIHQDLINIPSPRPQTDSPVTIPGSETRIVVYYTSLRVVRPTFEACRTVQSILSGFRVCIDERDVSMDSKFMEELQRILGRDERLTLPRVFIGGRYIGGAEELKHLHEIGELKKLVEGMPAAEPGVCETCGSYRFILCNECSGSHKIYSEKIGFRSCTSCNVNGLIRCPTCSTD
ncbi:hypothetical protein Ancab_007185 [Ancistrocladus abbreviatus]